MTNHQGIDPSTPEGFQQAIDALGMSITRCALTLGCPESSVKKWLKGRPDPHPTAAAMMRALLSDWRPKGWHMTGPMMKTAREDLGLSIEELADMLGVEHDVVELYESDYRGPPHFVAKYIDWLAQGYTP